MRRELLPSPSPPQRGGRPLLPKILVPPLQYNVNSALPNQTVEKYSCFTFLHKHLETTLNAKNIQNERFKLSILKQFELFLMENLCFQRISTIFCKIVKK